MPAPVSAAPKTEQVREQVKEESKVEPKAKEEPKPARRRRHGSPSAAPHRYR